MTHSADLPRIYELRDLLHTLGAPGTYFKNFDAPMEPLKRKNFLDIEADLRGLDIAAWNALKIKAAPLFERRHPKRGWQAAFDILNQAKAYNYLVTIGCTAVEFIPESKVRGEKTPDLQAMSRSVRVLCEVKTINISDNEASVRTQQSVGSVGLELPAQFFAKLSSTLEVASAQMASYRSGEQVRCVAFVVINFDDSLHEYVDDYWQQLERYDFGGSVGTLEAVFWSKPAFYSASVNSRPPLVLVRTLLVPGITDG